MKILVDITHPAHVHLFKHAIWHWQKAGQEVIITARKKDIAIDLLNEYGFDYIHLGQQGRGLSGLFRELIIRDIKLYRIVRREKPDVMISVAGVYLGPAGRLLGIPVVSFFDTEHSWVIQRLSYPFITAVCTNDSFQEELGKRQVRYPGYHELAYLHPNRFSPDEAVLAELGLAPDEKLFVVRFVSWEAIHDVGETGFSLETKRELIRRLSELGRVIITSEAELPPDLEPHRMRISPTKIHDILAFSSLYIGESSTMASESAVLGTPFIFVSSLRLGYTDEQEKRYDLGYTLRPDEAERALDLALELAQRENMAEEWQAKRRRMLKDKIDVTAWMISFVEKQVRSYKEQ